MWRYGVHGRYHCRNLVRAHEHLPLCRSCTYIHDNETASRNISGVIGQKPLMASWYRLRIAALPQNKLKPRQAVGFMVPFGRSSITFIRVIRALKTLSPRYRDCPSRWRASQPLFWFTVSRSARLSVEIRDKEKPLVKVLRPLGRRIGQSGGRTPVDLSFHIRGPASSLMAPAISGQ